MKPKIFALLLAIAAITTTIAFGRADENGPLVHEGIVDASLDEIWSAFTTKQGLESWMAAHADVDLKLGGKFRTHYDANGEIGDPKTIENTIICYEPKRMLAIKVSKAPEGFPFPNAIKNMWTVIYFEEIGSGKTRVREVSLGFGSDEESKRMRQFFDRGNALTLQRLQKRFAQKAGGKN